MKEERNVVSNQKDTVFRMVFKEKEALLNLYNAINGTDYQDVSDLEVVTLENVIYMGMKNDLSFVIHDQLSLYEHQSTFNPNMPLRDLFYIARNYEGLLKGTSLHTSRQIKIPTPQFIVFYNGTSRQPERRVLKLSDAFEVPTNEPELEQRVTMLNINAGNNNALLKKCKPLREYMIYVETLRKNQEKMTLEEAVKETVAYCIKHEILKEFLQKNQVEVTSMSIFEYDQELHMKTIAEEARDEGRAEGKEEGRAEGKEEGRAEGKEEGKAEGESLFARLSEKLLKEKAYDELEKATKDEAYRHKLYEKYHIGGNNK